MNSPARRRVAVGAVLALLIGPLLGPTAAGADTLAGTDPATNGSPATAEGATHTVTLITGDRVQVSDVAGGRSVVRFEPAPGREQVGMDQLTIDGRSLVLPLDVVPLIAENRVDTALFDVDALIDQGYDDAATGSIPLIADYPDTASASVQARAEALPAAAAAGPRLSSIEAVPLRVSKAGAAGFWNSIAPAAGRSAATRLSAGLDKVWLDAAVHPTLDTSVPQIGAPIAWQAGFDGTGVTVAVLDTGVDATHPDLAGRVSLQKDFSGSADVADHFGHGTHVAATIGGSGNGSLDNPGGPRKGVAPGATLISGKVLGDNGSGDLSQLIAGMEWAVAEHADVVNLSLGSGPTDGTDPVSTALNTLSAESGTLFVVAAGNDGPDSSTIDAPGSADLALTVGAVDRDENMADFSSRGPRLGDRTVKPDLTAPGVDIVAARAAGTTMGSPVDALYTSASGTSMATPHVAGSAALLLAAHPDWTAAALKDALISTARPGPGGIDEEGGGRVDIGRAVTDPLSATGTVSLGNFVDGDTAPASSTVSYANTGDQPLELALTMDLRSATGEHAPATGVTVSPSTLTVPAGGTATATVTVDPSGVVRGRYTGTLSATAGDRAAHTTLSLQKKAPEHTIKISSDDDFFTMISLVGEDPDYDQLTFIPPHVTRTFVLAEGDYFLTALTSGDGPGGVNTETSVVDPDFGVTADRELTLDASTATQVIIKTPKPSVQDTNLGFNIYREARGRNVSHSAQFFKDVKQLWVTPTEQATTGTFEYSSRWQLRAPMLQATAGPLTMLPEYLRTAEPLEGTSTARVVDAGTGSAADFAKVDARGAVALVRPSSRDAKEPITAGLAAGAKLLLYVPPADNPWFSFWSPQGARLAVPAAVLWDADATALIQRLADGPVTVKLSGSASAPYLYDVMQLSTGRIPDQVVHTVDDSNTMAVTASYPAQGGEAWTKEQRFAWRPWQQRAIVENQRYVRTPEQRTEYISTGDNWWQQWVSHLFTWDSLNPLQSGMTEQITQYPTAGTAHTEWFGPAVRPSIPTGVQDLAPTRTGDALTIRIPEVTDADQNHWSRTGSTSDASDVVTSSITEDGLQIASGKGVWGTYPATKADAQYQVHLTTARPQTEWETSKRTDTTWTFRSQRPQSGSVPLPLLQLGYSIPADLNNAVPADRVARIGLSVRLPDGSTPDGPAPQLSISYDDGDHWTAVTVRRHGPQQDWTALVNHPGLGRSNGYVTLKVRATDRSGNAVEQLIERAYALR